MYYRENYPNHIYNLFMKVVTMAKARSRAAARKVKDKWKAKTWYNVLAPTSFDQVTVAETLADEPEKLKNRVSEVSLQDITNDFRKSHIKLYFEINEIEGTNAHTRFIGLTLTSDYLRRMIRRKRSKVDGIYDVRTKDGARVRIKPFATTDHRIQNSQKKVIRNIMKKTISDQARASTLSAFVKTIIDGKLGSEIYKNCKKIYPVKRVEIYKTHVLSHPTTIIEEPVTPVIEKEQEKPKPDESKEEIEEQTGEESSTTKEEPGESEPIEIEEVKEPIEEPTGPEEKEPEEPEEEIKEEESEGEEVEKPKKDEEPDEPNEPEDIESVEKVEEESGVEEPEGSEEVVEEEIEESSEEPEKKNKKET
jgi:small subunit ribosomal protein S3Ae